MARRRTSNRSKAPTYRRGPDFAASDIFVSIAGFKAIHDELTIRIAPLTIISGINSGGKSSFMQPLLLLKQTLDAGFDPGAILLHGTNAKFTERAQTLSKGKARGSQVREFSVELQVEGQRRRVTYADSPEGFEIESDVFRDEDREVLLRQDLDADELERLEPLVAGIGQSLMEQAKNGFFPGSTKDLAVGIAVHRDRCFLEGVIATINADGTRSPIIGIEAFDTHTEAWAGLMRDLIHVPGLRGNPEREYPRAAVGQTFPGTFDTYVASVVLEWGDKNDGRLSTLSSQMERLGLTWKVAAKKKNDATVEVFVGRMPHAQRGGAQDLVSIADVGFGVSQTLPVVVSLLSARPGQIVYVEQPEIHLHPRAQVVLGQLLVEAANRGVKTVVETHSSLLIRAVQTELARKAIKPAQVSLNWINRNADGYAEVSVADIDSMGRFGEWPLDFDDVADEADVAYLEAIRTSRGVS